MRAWIGGFGSDFNRTSSAYKKRVFVHLSCLLENVPLLLVPLFPDYAGCDLYGLGVNSISVQLILILGLRPKC